MREYPSRFPLDPDYIYMKMKVAAREGKRERDGNMRNALGVGILMKEFVERIVCRLEPILVSIRECNCVVVLI